MQSKLRDTHILILIIGVVVVGVIVVTALFGRRIMHHADTVDIMAGSATVTADIADSDQERAKGLSDTPKLAPTHGMLFVFPDGKADGVWMKHMNYAIDALWLDGDKRVIYMVANLSPNTYPRVYHPPAPATYILEVPSGSINTWNLTVGSELLF